MKNVLNSRNRYLKDLNFFILSHIESHPSRVRGLKQTTSFYLFKLIVSHPSRVRGLKHNPIVFLFRRYSVAPLAGAWIETLRGGWLSEADHPSHPSRVRGLKQFNFLRYLRFLGRTPRGCVD